MDATGAIQAAVTEELVRRRSRELESQANTDPLTGLGNLRHLQREIAQLLDLQKRYDHPFALLLLDVDGLKRINDSHGHQAGDRVLMQVAMSVRRSIRTVDIAARMGGDEFCVLAPEQDAANVLKLGERLTAAVAEEVATPDDPPVGVSIGVVSCPEHGTEAEALIDIADQAMYRAKAAGEGVALGEPEAKDAAEEGATVRGLARSPIGLRPAYSISPWRMPIATAWVRVEASSLARMRLVWVRTVSVERPEALGHGVGLHPVGEHLEDLALAGAERAVALVEHDRRRQARVDVELARARGLDRPDQVLRGRVLAHVALDAGLQRLAEQARAAVGGEDHDRRAELAVQPAHHAGDVRARPPRVDDHHVGRSPPRPRAPPRATRRPATSAPSNAACSSTARTPARTTGWSSTIRQRGGSFGPPASRAAYPRTRRGSPSRSRARAGRAHRAHGRGMRRRTSWRARADRTPAPTALAARARPRRRGRRPAAGAGAAGRAALGRPGWALGAAAAARFGGGRASARRRRRRPSPRPLGRPPAAGGAPAGVAALVAALPRPRARAGCRGRPLSSVMAGAV